MKNKRLAGLLAVLVSFLYMFGGQAIKAVRRYGVPATILAFYILTAFTAKNWSIVLICLFPIILSGGYGVDSNLMKIFKNEWLVRAVYAILVYMPLAIPFFTGWLMVVVKVTTLVVTYQLRLGGFKLPNGKDFLFEDLARSMAISLAVII